MNETVLATGAKPGGMKGTVGRYKRAARAGAKSKGAATRAANKVQAGANLINTMIAANRGGQGTPAANRQAAGRAKARATRAANKAAASRGGRRRRAAPNVR